MFALFTQALCVFVGKPVNDLLANRPWRATIDFNHFILRDDLRPRCLCDTCFAQSGDWVAAWRWRGRQRKPTRRKRQTETRRTDDDGEVDASIDFLLSADNHRRVGASGLAAWLIYIRQYDGSNL